MQGYLSKNWISPSSPLIADDTKLQSKSILKHYHRMDMLTSKPWRQLEIYNEYKRLNF